MEAGGKAWDEREKIKDGAELGFKMAGPVLAYAVEKAGTDGLVAYASGSTNQWVSTLAKYFGTTDVQMALLLKDCKGDAERLAGKIQEIRRNHYSILE